MPTVKIKDTEEILSAYGFNRAANINPFGNGLINNTWLISGKFSRNEYILQRINKSIFTSPEDIAFNTRLIADHLNNTNKDYLFVSPLKAISDTDLVIADNEYYRAFPFIKNSHTIDVVQNPTQAYEAARQFGRFTKNLSDFNTSLLKITLPGFHDLSLRFKNFENGLQKGNKKRIQQSGELIHFIYAQREIVEEFEKIRQNPEFKVRVTHHDTKISNVLLDKKDKGLCVIDLDTVMPGYFISDVGDMMRTYLCPVSEEEKDFSKITIRPEFYNAIVNGYGKEMGDQLTIIEKDHFMYAGRFMIYMQALRFMTDHICDDVYYGAKYPGHNFVRAGNQLTVLQKLIDFEQTLV